MATLYSGLGGGAGYGEQSFRTSTYSGNLDDGFTQINVTSVFGPAGINFGGTSYTNVYLGTNGLLTFGSGVTSYTPGPLTALGQPALAAFWTDIDIRSSGEIYWDMDAGSGKMTITWLNAPAYSGTGTVSFQMQLTNLGGGDFNVEYLYNTIGFTNGGSGAAVVGTTNGTTQTLAEGSGNPAVLTTYASNDFDTNDPAGVYSMAVEGGVAFAGDGIVDGTAGNDTLNEAYLGDPDGDRVDGSDATGYAGGIGQDDFVLAGAGDDTVTSGLGRDMVYGGTGQDLLYGGAGQDTLDGGTDNDSLDGGSGNDLIMGGAGDDTLTGGVASAAITYTPAYTKISNGTFTVTGTSGRPNFAVQTVSGDNNLSSGTSGTLTGYNLGNTDSTETHTHTASGQIAGGRVLFNAISGNETLTLTIDGAVINLTTAIGAGMVTFTQPSSVYGINGTGQMVRLGAGASSTTVGTLVINVPFTTLALNSTGTTGNGLFYEYHVNTTPLNVAAALDGDDSLIGGDGRDMITGGAGNDVLAGDAGNDTLSGGLDNDSLSGGSGQDMLAGDTGNDSLLGGDGDDTLTGGDGNDTLSGGGDHDSLIGDAGDDALFGDLGNDQLFGGDGADVLEGGDGDDTLTGGIGADTLGGGGGMDYADYTASTAAVAVDLVAGTGLGGHASGDVVSGVDGLFGSAFDDTLLGFDGFSTLPGASYTNVFHGNAGNDVLNGRGGDDYLYGGSDDDTVMGGNGDDHLSGGAGEDALYGGAGNDSIDAGAGNDTVGFDAGTDSLDGGDDRDHLVQEFSTAAFGDTASGGSGGDDHDTLDLTSWGWSLTNVIYDPLDAENGTVEFLNGTGAVIGSMTFSNIEQVIPCFTPGVMISTDRGEVAVQSLRVGDLVLTRDAGLQPIRWIGTRKLGLADLIVRPHLRPVQIGQGALGNGLPLRNTLLSPQHRMVMEGAGCEMLFAEAEVLVAATHLTGLQGVDQILPVGVTYIHLLLDRHEIICANGSWTESFQPADRSLSAMDPAQRDEIAELFPQLAAGGAVYQSARLSLKAHEARVLLRAQVNQPRCQQTAIPTAPRRPGLDPWPYPTSNGAVSSRGPRGSGVLPHKITPVAPATLPMPRACPDHMSRADRAARSA